MLRIPLLLILVALLTACAVHRPALVWPEGIPAQTFFRTEWQASTANHRLQSEDEYLLWITRFYDGFNGVPGWLDITERMLMRLPQSEHEWVSARMFELGGRIGREWAKNNAVRRVNTRSAAVWRDALLEALARGELAAYMDRLSADVDALLAGELDNDLIRFERYYIDEFDC